MSELIITEFFLAAYWTDGANFIRLTDDGEAQGALYEWEIERIGVVEERKARVCNRGLLWLDGDVRVGEFMRYAD